MMEKSFKRPRKRIKIMKKAEIAEDQKLEIRK